MEFTVFKSARDTAPTILQQPWPWLCEIAGEFMALEKRRSDKLAHDAMIFGRCAGHRAKANVEFLSGLAADFDLGPTDPRYVTFDGMCDRLERERFAFIAYTTTANAAQHNRFRLLMPYARDVPFALCQPAWHACNGIFAGAIDASTKDESRLSFMPAEWIENPYLDKVKGLVTLAEPFNAMRVNINGKPILSDGDIAGLQFGLPTVATSVATTASAPAGAPRARTSTPSGSIAPLSAAERHRASYGKGRDDPCWRLLRDFDRSPLVTQAMRNPPTQPSDRVFKFLGAVAWRAVNKPYPITVEAMTTLAEQFCWKCLSRAPSAEIARRAEDALAFAIRNRDTQASKPSQPVAGI